jgi:hypothetical protein
VRFSPLASAGGIEFSGLATKLFESMAVGKAIVASAFGWIVDPLDHLLTEESG